MTIENIILTTLLIFITLTAIGIITFFFLKFKKMKKENSSTLQKKYLELNDELKQKQSLLDETIIDYRNKLLNISNLTAQEIKQELKNSYQKNMAKELALQLHEYKEQLQTNKDQILTKLLIDSYQNILEESMHQSTISIVKLDDVNLKGRIIGKDGRNKKVFEYLMGVDLIIDKVSDFITVASLNPIRRNIATNVLNELIKSKNIEPAKIESLFEQETNKFNDHLYEIGKSTCYDKLHVTNLNEAIYPYIGRLNYRSSYSQNILSHSLECAYIAQKLAAALNLDQNKAKLAAFFHDIGKAVDFEIDQNHVDAGITIAKECHLDDYIIEAIKTHHNEGTITSIYSEITKMADAISAARPGARIDSYDEYIKRVNTLENICKEFEAVNSAYAIKSGRQLRVFVNPKKINNYEELELLSYQIKERIENDSEVGSYKIKVVLIKEDKLSFETSQQENLKTLD